MKRGRARGGLVEQGAGIRGVSMHSIAETVRAGRKMHPLNHAQRMSLCVQQRWYAEVWRPSGWQRRAS